MPSISATVAQVNPVAPWAACRSARAVHLCAFTCGRRRGPGSAAAMTDRFCSSTLASTTSAGVGQIPRLHPSALSATLAMPAPQ